MANSINKDLQEYEYIVDLSTLTNTTPESLFSTLDESKIQCEFEPSVSKADQIDYALAAACGIISATLDILWADEYFIDFEKASYDGEETAEKIIKKLAKSKTINKIVDKKPYTKNDLNGAIRHLEETFKIPSDESLKDILGGGLQHHLRDFSHHASPIGLICSILTQFTYHGYGVDVSGDLIDKSKLVIDKEYFELIGRNFSEKVFLGTFYWIMHLASDMAGSSQNAGKGTGIPGPILSLVKEISSLPIFNKRNKNGYKEFSVFISKLFNGTSKQFPGIKFDLREEIGIAEELTKQIIPIVVNECLVRSCYFVRYLFLEIKKENIKALKDLKGNKKILPFGNRIIKRMCTVSTGTFMTIVTAKDAVAAKGNTGDFLLRINYFGIISFAIACKADANYISEDCISYYRSYVNKHGKEKSMEYYNNLPSFNGMVLSSEYKKILYSLEMFKVIHDIKVEKDTEKADIKKEWLKEWKKIVSKKEKTLQKELFITNELELYKIIKNEKDKNDNDWLRVIALELSLFIPFTPLYSDKNYLYKKVKYKYQYEQTFFLDKHHILSTDEYNKIVKAQKKYQNILNNKKTKIAIGTTAVLLISVATGGLADIFAPEIATFLVGDTLFAGLKGVALNNACLAFFGLGSLAAGGFGMAGGTIVIAGGGAIISLATTSAITSISINALSDEGYILSECSKLLTFCDLIVLQKHEDIESLFKLSDSLSKYINMLENYFEENKKTKLSKEEKKVFEKTQKSIKYLKRCNKEIIDMINKQAH